MNGGPCIAILFHDFIGMNDPIIQTNFREVYGKIMKEDSNTWSAIQFLKTCKDTIHGFDYRVLYSKTGLPTAVMYMTSRLRYNLLRYGNIMFIDWQKRKYNKLNWPYIGPVIKNSDNCIGVTCNAIVTTEDTDTYTCIFKAMVSIEPWWSPIQLKLLYTDRLVSKRLLSNLDIQDTCLLHGDYYHLFRENWPKTENFGPTVFKLIKPYLYSLLLIKTKPECERALVSAREKLIGHPCKLD